MSDRQRRRLAVVMLLAVTLVGCAYPFSTRPREYGPPIPVGRTRTIDRLALDPYQEEGSEEDPGERAPPDPFAGAGTTEITLEQVRAWTLENNVDVRVALIDPVIANESLSEEEGAFEAVFFSNFDFRKTDTPTASALDSAAGGQGQQSETITFDTGVRVPLRTGGEATVRLPFNRLETNNQFALLNPSVTSDLEFSISQPLLRGGGRWANTHQIRVASIQTGIQEARTKLEVIRQIAAADRAYWRLYAAREALVVRQQQYELALAQLERAERQVRAGKVAEIEIIRAESGLAERLEAIINAQNDVLLRQRELKRLVNVDGLDLDSDVMLIPASVPDPIPYDLERDQLVRAGLANRMEMLELELQLAIDESTIAFNRNQALPLFTVDYTYRVNGLGGDVTDALDQLAQQDFEDHFFGVSAEIPIGNQAARSRVQRTILERLQRLATREAQELTIEQEVLDAVDTLENGWQRILAARQATLLAIRELRAEERQFNVGMNTSQDVLDAATRLAEAQLTEIDAITEYQIALVDLAFATGTLLGAARVNWQPLDPRPEEATDTDSYPGSPPPVPTSSGSTEGDESISAQPTSPDGDARAQRTRQP